MEPAVVHRRELEPGIQQIVLEDRSHKNSLSGRICAGLVQAFREVSMSEDCRAVIITGYDSYFCTGASQQSLFEPSAGAARFTDHPVYDLPLACEVPVIAAMQGHSIGGGFVFGLFADFVVLSRESVYTANFMKYGFTPGFGSTLILREKLGLPLAQEMLFTARTFRGNDLAERAVPFPVLPRAEVLAYAQRVARELADKPRHSLVALKNHMSAPLRTQLPTVTRQELAVHERTLRHPEVTERIRNLFGK